GDHTLTNFQIGGAAQFHRRQFRQISAFVRHQLDDSDIIERITADHFRVKFCAIMEDHRVFRIIAGHHVTVGKDHPIFGNDKAGAAPYFLFNGFVLFFVRLGLWLFKLRSEEVTEERIVAEEQIKRTHSLAADISKLLGNDDAHHRWRDLLNGVDHFGLLFDQFHLHWLDDVAIGDIRIVVEEALAQSPADEPGSNRYGGKDRQRFFGKILHHSSSIKD